MSQKKGEGKKKAIKGKGQNKKGTSSFRMSHRLVVFSPFPIPRPAGQQHCLYCNGQQSSEIF